VSVGTGGGARLQRRSRVGEARPQSCAISCASLLTASPAAGPAPRSPLPAPRSPLPLPKTDVAESIGRELLVYGRRIPKAEMFARIDAVSADTVRLWARGTSHPLTQPRARAFQKRFVPRPSTPTRTHPPR
jgi:hypothetical protein